MRLIIIAFLLHLAVATQARAEPLVNERVPADAKWLVHIDFDALRESSLSAQLSESLFAGRWSGGKFKRMQKELGIDASTDLHSVTLFDTRFQKHHGLIMMRSDNLDAERLSEELANRHADLTKSDYRGHQLMTWTRGAGKRYEHELTSCLHGSDTVLISRDIDVLKRTLEVLDGESESLASDSPLAAPVVAGSILCIRSKGSIAHELPFRSSMMRKSKQFSMSLSDQDGKVSLNAAVVTRSAEDGTKLGKIVDGFRAMGLARHGSDEAGKRIFAGLSAEVTDTLVEANWRMSSEDAEKVMAYMKKHRQQHRHRKHRKSSKKRSEEAKVESEKSSSSADETDSNS